MGECSPLWATWCGAWLEAADMFINHQNKHSSVWVGKRAGIDLQVYALCALRPQWGLTFLSLLIPNSDCWSSWRTSERAKLFPVCGVSSAGIRCLILQYHTHSCLYITALVNVKQTDVTGSHRNKEMENPVNLHKAMRGERRCKSARLALLQMSSEDQFLHVAER